jgi:hypothetical protein
LPLCFSNPIYKKINIGFDTQPFGSVFKGSFQSTPLQYPFSFDISFAVSYTSCNDFFYSFSILRDLSINIVEWDDLSYCEIPFCQENFIPVNLGGTNPGNQLTIQKASPGK